MPNPFLDETIVTCIDLIRDKIEKEKMTEVEAFDFKMNVATSIMLNMMCDVSEDTGVCMWVLQSQAHCELHQGIAKIGQKNAKAGRHTRTH